MHPLSRSRFEQGSLCCLLLLGCIVGVWLSLRQMLPEVLQTALLRQQLFPWLLLEMAGFLLCSGLAGFSAVGQPVACAVLFLHGMWFGWSILQQMTTHAVRVLLWLMPYGIGASFLLLLAARETLWLSNLFFCYAFHRQWEENMPHCRRLYLVRYAVILGLFSGLSLLCLGLQKLQALWT